MDDVMAMICQRGVSAAASGRKLLFSTLVKGDDMCGNLKRLGGEGATAQ